MQVVRDIRCNKHKHKQVVRDQTLDALSSFPQRFEEKTLTLSLHNQWQKLFRLVENENYCSSSDWLLQFPPALKSPWEVDWPKELPQMPEEGIKNYWILPRDIRGFGLIQRLRRRIQSEPIEPIDLLISVTNTSLLQHALALYKVGCVRSTTTTWGDDWSM